MTDEEHFEDVLEDNGDTILLPPPGPEGASKDCVTVEDKGGMDLVAGKLAQLQGRQQYRVGHRNPLYCGAERTCLWELASVRASPDTIVVWCPFLSPSIYSYPATIIPLCKSLQGRLQL